jgi:Serine dehydrogenase proteinase
VSTPTPTPAERDSNKIIEELIDTRGRELEEALDADVLTYIGPLFVGLYADVVDEIKDAVEMIDSKRDRLAVVIETPGGYVDVAERMARIFRHHYAEVEFIVPTFCMSAGTVLVMSGDEIHMDYAAVLGPIDPQLPIEEDRLLPALGYLVQYDRLLEKSKNGTITSAELTFLCENFDPAALYQYEQERKLSVELLKRWLATYKFKNWTTTQTQGLTVTPQMREQRAEEIGEALNDTDRWHSHSRGIPMDVLVNDLNLQIEDFGSKPRRRTAVHGYFRLLKDYRMRRSHGFFALHTRGRYVGY